MGRLRLRPGVAPIGPVPFASRADRERRGERREKERKKGRLRLFCLAHSFLYSLLADVFIRRTRLSPRFLKGRCRYSPPSTAPYPRPALDLDDRGTRGEKGGERGTREGGGQLCVYELGWWGEWNKRRENRSDRGKREKKRGERKKKFG